MYNKAYTLVHGHRRIRPRKVIAGILRNALLLVFSLMIAMPFFWMITNAIKTKDEIWARPPVLFPAVPQ